MRALARVSDPERERPFEQFGGGVVIASIGCPPAGSGEVAGCALAERARFVVEWAELCAVAVALFEVIAEDLLVLVEALAGETFEPVREPFVEGRAQLLRGRPVRRVADEDVLEAEGGFADEARRRRPHEVAVGEGLELLRHRRTRIRRRELDDRAVMEELALDRPPLERVTGARVEAVETRTKQRVQTRRQGVGVDIALEHPRHQLLGKERIAGRSQRKPGPHRRRGAQTLQQHVHLGLPERLEAHRGLPSRAALE